MPKLYLGTTMATLMTLTLRAGIHNRRTRSEILFSIVPYSNNCELFILTIEMSQRMDS